MISNRILSGKHHNFHQDYTVYMKYIGGFCVKDGADLLFLSYSESMIKSQETEYEEQKKDGKRMMKSKKN